MSNSRVTSLADHAEDPPVVTVNVNALSPEPPSISFPESQARSTMTSVQSTTETGIYLTSFPGSASPIAVVSTTIM